MSRPEPGPIPWLSRRRLLVSDGAMGTALQDAGLPAGACPELLNLERPGLVRAVSRDHLEAGAEILQTNSFGGSPARLAAHGLESRCAEVNRAAATIARGVAGSRALVAGSIGPTGLLLEPHGPLGAGLALEGFGLQSAALAAGGCDLLLIETMTCLTEAVLAVRAAAATGLPVIATMAFEDTPRGVFTLFGDSPEGAARELTAAGACALGANCATGPAAMIGMIAALRRWTALPLLAQPNAGIPALERGVLRYPETPAEFASHVASLAGAGATIIGGCCGTTPAHVRAVASEVRRLREATGAPPG